MFNKVFLLASLLTTALSVNAQRRVTLTNHCGHGVPTVVQGPNILSTGQPITVNGALSSVIAYLQDGNCLFNGEHCTLVEFTLVAPGGESSGRVSSADLSLIPPHSFNVPAAFRYTNACVGDGSWCANSGCQTAFRVPTDNRVQVQCNQPNAGIEIIFCDSRGSGAVRNGVSQPF